jgi:hypothetical protein
VSDFQKVILVLNALVLKLYNLEVASVKEIKSYDDNNFHVTIMFNPVCLSLYRSYEIFFHLGKNDSLLPDIHDADACPNGYVLEVLNSLNSSKKSYFQRSPNKTLPYHILI